MMVKKLLDFSNLSNFFGGSCICGLSIPDLLFYWKIFNDYIWPAFKGSFYSENTDPFVISPNRRTKLFSWTWILKFCHFKGLKSCHIRLHFAIWAFSASSGPYVTSFEPFKTTQFLNIKFRKMIWFICLDICMTNASVPSE